MYCIMTIVILYESKGNFLERYLKRTQNTPLSQLFNALFLCAPKLFFLTGFAFLHIVLTLSHPVLTLLLLQVLEKRRWLVMVESAGDGNKLLDALKTQEEMGHVVNMNINSHQRQWNM